MNAFPVVAAALLLGCSPRPTVVRAAHTGATASAATAGQGCGDLLDRLGKKPPRARFNGCAFFPDEQGKPLRATYEVAGRDAAAVEAQLVRTTGLNRLKRSCCAWDAAPAGFSDAAGRSFLITMASGETTISTRAGWPEIGAFYVTVQMMTEEI